MDVDPSNTTNKQTERHSVDGEHSMEMDEFPFPSSQALTHFKGFQKEVIKATLDGRDSVVLQPTGSGKSNAFNFLPYMKTRKQLSLAQQ